MMKRKSYSKEELMKLWKEELFPELGKNAKKRNWLTKNEYCWFVRRASIRYGSWTNFIKACGEEPLSKDLKSKEELLKIWEKELIPKLGTDAKSGRYLQGKGYGWFVAQINSKKRYGKWSIFIKTVGETPLAMKQKSKAELMKIWKEKIYPEIGEDAKNCTSFKGTEYSWFPGQVRFAYGEKSWTTFIDLTGEVPLVRQSKSKQDLLKLWLEEIYPKHGENAKKRNWFKGTEYSWFVGQVGIAYRKGKKAWTNFIEATGEELSRRDIKSEEELMKIWMEEIVPKYGEENAKNRNYVKNEYGWFVGQVRKVYGKWSNFIKATEGYFVMPADKMNIY